MPIAQQEIKDAWLRQLGRIPNLVDGKRWGAAEAEVKDVLDGWKDHPNWGVRDQPSFSRQASIVEDLTKTLTAISRKSASSAKTNSANALTKIKAETVASAEPPPEEPVEEPEPPPSKQPDPDIFWGRNIASYKSSGSEPALIQPRDSHVTDVADPFGGPDTVMKMVTNESASKVTENPRCEALSSNIRPPKEYWRGGAFMIDDAFPLDRPGQFQNIWQTFAQPWNGSPAISAKIEGQYLLFMKNAQGLGPVRMPAEGPPDEAHHDEMEDVPVLTPAQHRLLVATDKPILRALHGPLQSAWQVLWKIDMSNQRNKKIRFLEHVFLPSSQGQSKYEVWVNDVLMFSGNVSIYDSSTASGNFHVYIQNYHRKGLPETHVWHWPMRVASTRAAAEYLR